MIDRDREAYSVLVIDDDESILDLYGEVFKRAGHKVSLAASGEAGLKLAFSEHPDVVLLDVQLPDMRGTEVLERLRADAWGAGAAVIMLTNMPADSASVVRSIAQGRPDFYLIKVDWLPDKLVEKVGDVVYTHNSQHTTATV
jgi:DNA-binding response OmpR family regulator